MLIEQEPRRADEQIDVARGVQMPGAIGAAADGGRRQICQSRVSMNARGQSRW